MVSSEAERRKVLVLGADGMLGRAWQQFLVSRGIEHDAVSRGRAEPRHLDVTDRGAVEGCLARGYEWVINCSAYTAVDAAEAAQKDAWEVNCEAVGYVAESAARHNCRVVHYSTDYVFSGRANVPYPVDTPIEPVNVYGRSKAEGEARLRSGLAEHLLIRTSWVYAPWGKNFVSTMRRLLRSQPRLSVVDDQRGRPTSVFTLVDATFALMQRVSDPPTEPRHLASFGTYHVTNSGDCTWFEFAVSIRDAIGASCEVVPCSTEQFPRPAPRPSYSVLDLTKTVAAIGALPHWRDALSVVLEQPSEES